MFLGVIFETSDETSTQLEIYIRIIIAEEHDFIDCMYIIVKFYLIFFHYDYFCETLHPAMLF